MRYPVTPGSELGCQRVRTEYDVALAEPAPSRTPTTIHPHKPHRMTVDALKQESIRSWDARGEREVRSLAAGSAADSERRSPTMSGGAQSLWRRLVRRCRHVDDIRHLRAR